MPRVTGPDGRTVFYRIDPAEPRPNDPIADIKSALLSGKLPKLKVIRMQGAATRKRRKFYELVRGDGSVWWVKVQAAQKAQATGCADGLISLPTCAGDCCTVFRRADAILLIDEIEGVPQQETAFRLGVDPRAIRARMKRLTARAIFMDSVERLSDKRRQAALDLFAKPLPVHLIGSPVAGQSIWKAPKRPT